MLVCVRYRGMFRIAPDPKGKSLCGRPLEGHTIKDPGTVRERMQRLHLAALRRNPERSWGNADQGGGLTKIEPRFDAVLRRAVHGNCVLGPQ